MNNRSRKKDIVDHAKSNDKQEREGMKLMDCGFIEGVDDATPFQQSSEILMDTKLGGFKNSSYLPFKSDARSSEQKIGVLYRGDVKLMNKSNNTWLPVCNIVTKDRLYIEHSKDTHDYLSNCKGNSIFTAAGVFLLQCIHHGKILKLILSFMRPENKILSRLILHTLGLDQPFSYEINQELLQTYGMYNLWNSKTHQAHLEVFSDKARLRRYSKLYPFHVFPSASSSSLGAMPIVLATQFRS